MSAFIRIVEVWVPDLRREHLVLSGGYYGNNPAFEALSRRMLFGYDEGLPGRAWAAQRPIVLNNLSDPSFRRTEGARHAGLNCGVAIPVLAGDYLLAVLVLFCGVPGHQHGAIEVWCDGGDPDADMRLIDGYYGGSTAFEDASRQMQLSAGHGLPGQARQRGRPVLMSDLGNDPRFARREAARIDGIAAGLALPVDTGDGTVVTLLSATATPIAERFEIWIPNEDRTGLLFDEGFCSRQANLADDYASACISRIGSAIGRVWQSGIPEVRDDLADDPSIIGQSARSVGLTHSVAIPVLSGGRLSAVAAWYF